jgi:putative ABC transport system permease protein
MTPLGRTGLPPRFLARILGWMTPPMEREPLLGDFEESFTGLAENRGRIAALRWYVWSLLKLAPAFTKNSIVWRTEMLIKNLKTAWRLLAKHKGYAFINLAGLAIGITSSVLIFLFVRYESSYDRFHEKSDRIYRVACGFPLDDRQWNQINTPAILSQLLRETVPEVESATKLAKMREVIVSHGEHSILENDVIATDSNIFSVFSIALLSGSAGEALARPNSVVLSRSAARKWFGNEDPIHQTITLTAGGPFELTVTGVAEDLPANSHFHFGYLVSVETFPWSKDINFGSNNYATYFSVRNGVTARVAEQKLLSLVSQYFFKGKSKFSWKFWLQPLTEIHLTSDLFGEFEPNGSKVYVFVFLTISLFIILIASINFMNLATARYSTRIKEVGIRKVVGSSRLELMRQFLLESVLYGLLACLLSLVLLKCFLPAFRNFVGKPLELNYFDNWHVLPLILGYAVLVGFLAGFYPALFFASFRPITFFSKRSSLGKSRGALGIRSGLVVFQFAISIFLMIDQQLKYFQNERLGFDREQVLVIKNTEKLGPQLEAFKQTVKQHSAVLNVAGASALPGTPFNNWYIRGEGAETQTLDFLICDYDYLATLRLTMTKGRFFSREYGSDSSAIILNEQAVRDLGYAEPLGKRIQRSKQVYTVIGVVQDFHYQSLHQKIKHMGIILSDPRSGIGGRYVAVRIQPSSTKEILRFLDNTWQAFSPSLKFEYSFLDEDYGALYRTEQKAGKITLLFSGLAITVSLLGLLGLAAFSAERRTKEIGIRKTLGASERRIIAMLSQEHLKWVLLANIFAWPLAYAAMNAWLRNFSYRIGVRFWTFGLAGVVALILALMIVSVQAVKAARANPVEALKYE